MEVFCDGITEFLTDNTDFIVVGVLGLQNAGKSSILNSLVRPGGEKEELFRVQNYEHQASLNMEFPSLAVTPVAGLAWCS